MTLKVHVAPALLLAVSVAVEPDATGFGLTETLTAHEPVGRTVGCGVLAGDAGGGTLLPAPTLNGKTGCNLMALGATLD